MKRPLYLFKNGRLRRRQNTLWLHHGSRERAPLAEDDLEGEPSWEGLSGKTPIPVEALDSIYVLGEVDINTKLVTFLSQASIPVFFFDYYGNFTAVLSPREDMLGGRTRLAQARLCLSPERRLAVAKAFVRSGAFHMGRNVKYAMNRRSDIKESDMSDRLEEMKGLEATVEAAESVEDLMGAEGAIRKHYYECWSAILGGHGNDFTFNGRTRRPPGNEVNALLSFLNTLCYSLALKQLRHTALDPTLSFLHAPGSRRYSLALDIAEIYKPLYVDRLLFSLVRKRTVQQKHFERALNGVYLSESGRRVVVEKWDEMLRRTVKHRRLNKSVSYDRLVRYECYALVRHVLSPDDEAYTGFRAWW